MANPSGICERVFAKLCVFRGKYLLSNDLIIYKIRFCVIF